MHARRHWRSVRPAGSAFDRWDMRHVLSDNLPVKDCSVQTGIAMAGTSPAAAMTTLFMQVIRLLNGAKLFQQRHRAWVGQLDGPFEPERIGAWWRRRSASTRSRPEHCREQRADATFVL